MDETSLIIFALLAGGAYAVAQYMRRPPAGVENSTAAPGSTGTGIVPAPAPGSAAAKLPRGIRNRNPLNIKYSPGNRWVGQAGRDGGGFVVFDTAEHGVRAAAKLLRTYMTKYGLTTIDAIAKRWSPDANGYSGAYAAAVSKFSGVAKDKPLSMSDPTTLAKVIAGMMGMENGAAYVNWMPQSQIVAIVTQA